MVPDLTAITLNHPGAIRACVPTGAYVYVRFYTLEWVLVAMG